MTDVAKADGEIHVVKAARKSAVLTGHPYLPALRTQIRHVRDWGIPAEMGEDGDLSPIWIDDVSGLRSTNWSKYLIERAELMRAFDHFGGDGHVVFFDTPLCVGFSRSHALDMIRRLRGAGASFFVHSMGKGCKTGSVFGPRAKLDMFWDQHRRQLKAAQVRVSRYNVRARAA